MTLEEKGKRIIEDIKKETGVNPVRIFKEMAKKEYISMHGPEHHVLDGASILVAYRNAGGQIDLDESLDRLLHEGLRMPGAMCGLWGVCGAITSVGAALAIIDHTGPLSEDGSWGDHMAFTSAAVHEMGTINGPRCCKRDAMVAFKNAVDYVNRRSMDLTDGEGQDPVLLEYEAPACDFSSKNQECIKGRCPFYSPSKEI